MPPMISPRQARAAVAVLRIRRRDLAAAVPLAENTLDRVLSGGSVRPATLQALQGWLEARGLVFDADGLGLSWRELPDAVADAWSEAGR